MDCLRPGRGPGSLIAEDGLHPEGGQWYGGPGRAPPTGRLPRLAAHGWCPPDGEVYDQVQAEKAWARQLALFTKALA